MIAVSGAGAVLPEVTDRNLNLHGSFSVSLYEERMVFWPVLYTIRSGSSNTSRARVVPFSEHVHSISGKENVAKGIEQRKRRQGTHEVRSRSKDIAI